MIRSGRIEDPSRPPTVRQREGRCRWRRPRNLQASSRRELVFVTVRRRAVLGVAQRVGGGAGREARTGQSSIQLAEHRQRWWLQVMTSLAARAAPWRATTRHPTRIGSRGQRVEVCDGRLFGTGWNDRWQDRYRWQIAGWCDAARRACGVCGPHRREGSAGAAAGRLAWREGAQGGVHGLGEGLGDEESRASPTYSRIPEAEQEIRAGWPSWL